MLTFREAMARCPLVAILRGVRPEHCVDIGTALVEAGFTLIEVPLNSPEPVESIARMSRELGPQVLVGAGTVTRPQEVDEVAQAGGRLIVTPHADTRVIVEAKALGLTAVPGFATPTEAFAVIEAGADALKLFPAEANPPKVLRAMRAVLPRELQILPVGSISVENMGEYWAAGANGFGLGSALYKAGATPDQVAKAAAKFKAAIQLLTSATPSSV
ncbi:MAG TPA: 2-dehydro-3-deoxy-6-phosphogalactonate aldolase [Burkholderiales bacterium]|nr:2-dehydro-3-deoxy-6-phosphogalactonate aldolase [Burkholderiales bacterium]